MMLVKAYELRSGVLPLLRRFQAAQVSDKVAERRARSRGTLAAVAFFLAFLGFMGTMLGTSGGVPWLFAIPAVFVAAGITLMVGYVRAKRYDLDDRKLGAIVRLLTMLRADTPREAPADLRIDFRGYEKGGEKLSDEKLDRWGSQRVKKYAHPWLRLAGLLADGTRYQLSVTEAITRKEKRKRKYTKVRESVLSKVTLQLRLRAAKYGEAEAIAAGLRQAVPPPYLTLKRIAARGQRLSLTLVTPKTVLLKGRSLTPQMRVDHQLTGDMLLQTFLWAYDGIAQTVAKSA